MAVYGDGGAKLDQDVAELKQIAQSLLEVMPTANRSKSVATSSSFQKDFRSKFRRVETTHPSSSSLYAIVPSSVHDAVDTHQEETWQDILRRAAQDASDPDKRSQCQDILDRFESLSVSVPRMEKEANAQAHEVLINERVDQELEKKEQDFDALMKVREKRVVALDQEIENLQEENDKLDEAIEKNQSRSSQGSVDNVHEKSTVEAKRLEVERLREIRDLRVEEQTDIQAALDSLKRRQRERQRKARLSRLSAQSSSKDVSDDQRVKELKSHVAALEERKKELEDKVLRHEDKDQEVDLSDLSSRLEETNEKVKEKRGDKERVRQLVGDTKKAMAGLVDRVLQIYATEGEEGRNNGIVGMALLQVLADHNGELPLDQLQRLTLDYLESLEGDRAPKTPRRGRDGVPRAVYMLLNAGLVDVDRSTNPGSVTSLIL